MRLRPSLVPRRTQFRAVVAYEAWEAPSPSVLPAIRNAVAPALPSKWKVRSSNSTCACAEALKSGSHLFACRVRFLSCFADFGLFKGTDLSFDDTWAGNECISETGLEKRLNKDGLRFRMNRTEKEADEVGPMYDLPGFTVNLPFIGETYFGPPKVANIWEALGFTATSNNEARQKEKLKAIEQARLATKGVNNGPGKEIRADWLKKYGYPRLVGSGGIFYADQLSTDKVAMGGFNMGKSGKIWPVPEVVEREQYGGSKGWGMKSKGPAIDGLPADKSGM